MHEDSNSNGYSRWYLCDLQVHTVADQNHRYGDYGGREPAGRFAEDLIRATAESGVDVIAVTDHNRADWYPVLREAGEARGVWVFPGTEVSVNGCHLLAIWDCTSDGFQLAQDFLRTLWKPGTTPFLPNSDPRPVSKGQIEEIAGRAKDHAALVFAPHSTLKKNGLFASGVVSHSGDIAKGDLTAEALQVPLSNERKARAGLDEFNRHLDDLEEQVEDLEELRREAADLTERLKRAEASGAEDLLKETGELTADERAFTRLLKWPSAVRTALNGLEASAAAPELPRGKLTPKKLGGIVRQLKGSVQQGSEAIEEAVHAAEDDLTRLHATWSTAVKERRSELEAELEAAGVADLKDLIEMQRRLAEIEPLISNLPAVQKAIKDNSKERRKLLTKLRTARQEKSRAMQETAERLTAEIGTRVRVSVDPLSDRSQLVDRLLAECAGQNVRRDQIERVSEHAPPTIAKAIATGTKAVGKLGCTTGTAAKLAGLSTAAVRRVEETATPDRVSIEVNLASDTGADDWSDVNDVSPGQRATAMVALALASGHEPLIIDQPEDDLDNRYIFEEVVRVLARVCEHRQVIVATHNANIPVLGDAELVLALDAEAKRSRVLACGGFEDAMVASYAREILEGGDEAFMARHKRYLTHLDN